MKMCEDQNFLDIAEQLSQIALECRMIIIGSYKCIPREKVVISCNCVRFDVPLVEDDTSFVTLDVKYRDIIKLLIHFEQTMPVLFFYMSTSTGTKMRDLLGMQDPKGPYYDPTGKDCMHRRITLLLDTLPEKESKTILTSLFSQEGKIVELNLKEANDIFVRALPRNSLITTWKLNQNLANTINVNDDIQTIIIYPPPPAQGGIVINTEHYLCLAKDEFLNDVIIEFYLKYLTLEILSEFDQHRTHVFNSFFYKCLTNPRVQDTQNIVPMIPAAKRHARVQKWTKNVNIFEKDFVIIPINKDAHWFLAIICFPGLVGEVSTRIAENNQNDSLANFHSSDENCSKTVQKSKKIENFKSKAVTFCSIMLDESKENEAEENETQIINFEEQKEIKSPCILIFDSLAGANRSSVITMLRDYLSCEYVVKFGVKKTFSKDTIKGVHPKVPQQSNSTDCGLYVLQYMESFFKNPIKDYTLPINLKTWFEEIVVTRKREELSNLIIKLMNNTKGDETINLPTINFPTQNGKLKLNVKNQI